MTEKESWSSIVSVFSRVRSRPFTKYSWGSRRTLAREEWKAKRQRGKPEDEPKLPVQARKREQKARGANCDRTCKHKDESWSRTFFFFFPFCPLFHSFVRCRQCSRSFISSIIGNQPEYINKPRRTLSRFFFSRSILRVDSFLEKVLLHLHNGLSLVSVRARARAMDGQGENSVLSESQRKVSSIFRELLPLRRACFFVCLCLLPNLVWSSLVDGQMTVNNAAGVVDSRFNERLSWIYFAAGSWLIPN